MQKPDANDPAPVAAQVIAQPAMPTETPQPTPQPVSNALNPDKTVEVPKYAVCMASDPTFDEAAINAIIANKPRK
jgi:hypothetical protein